MVKDGNGWMEDVARVFEKIYDETYKKVFFFVVSRCRDIADCEDIVQDVFVELYKTLQKRGEQYVKTAEAFVIRLAKVRLHRYYRGTFFQPEVKTPFSGEDGGFAESESFLFRDNIDVQENYIRRETTEEIWRQLRKENAAVQKIFVLYYYLDQPIGQIAKALKLTESAVKHKLYDTLNKLRRLYGAEGR